MSEKPQKALSKGPQTGQFLAPTTKRIFVTGGTGFLGYRVVRALLDENVPVTVLVQPGGEDKLGSLRSRVELVQGDVWNPASLRGRARNHSAVVHLVGGIKPDPARGLTFRHLNFVSARNVAQMAVGDGIPHFIFSSASVAPFGVASGYMESKREAEQYLKKTGLTWTIVRMPPLYASGQPRNPLYLLISILSRIPILGFPLGMYAPMSVDTAARGIASLALSGETIQDRIVSPGYLRRLGRTMEKRLVPIPETLREIEDDSGLDEPPFGWLPPA